MGATWQGLERGNVRGEDGEGRAKGKVKYINFYFNFKIY